MVIKGFFVLLVIGLFFAYNNRTEKEHVFERALESEEIKEPMTEIVAVPIKPKRVVNRYKCDGRQYCSQMRSCAEATFFLRNCPNTKMDGYVDKQGRRHRGDGIPCERQWCH